MSRFQRFMQLPVRALVPAAEVERLREKFLKSRSAADSAAFWQAVQDSKQPIISEQPDYGEMNWSYDSLGTPTDDFYGPIG